MTSNKNSFVFYETFESVIEELPEEMQLKFYRYITQYGLHGIEPEVAGIEKAIWTQIQFAIDQAQNRRKRAIENGNKGGRPNKTITENNPNETQKNQTITENNPNETQKNQTITENNPNETQAKPNNNLNVNVNVNANANDNVNDNVKSKGTSCEVPSSKSSRFIPPTLAEVEAYCFTRNNSVNAQQFIDFYSSKNWYVGKNKMTDWRASVRLWESRSKTSPTSRGHPSGMAVDDSLKPNQIIM